jgi:hypothetical protein
MGYILGDYGRYFTKKHLFNLPINRTTDHIYRSIYLTTDVRRTLHAKPLGVSKT